MILTAFRYSPSILAGYLSNWRRKNIYFLKTSQAEYGQHSGYTRMASTTQMFSIAAECLTRGGAVAVGRKGVKCWCVCVCWCWWLCWWNWKANGWMPVEFWDVRPDEPDAELDADGPPGVERPAAVALFSAPGTLRLPSRSGGIKKWEIRSWSNSYWLHP